MHIFSIPDTMHAALYEAPGVVRFAEVPLKRPEAGELLVQIDTALTCGTDVKCYRRGHPVLLKSLPSPFGHEFSGTVIEAGQGITRFKPGDRVVAANSAPCGVCFYCTRQQWNLCESLSFLNGAYAEYLVIPARITEKNTYHIPEGLSFEAATFCEPLADAIRGIDLTNIQPGEHIAVMGLGPIGQMMVRLATLQGAHVTAMARNTLKLRMAQQFGGADAIINLAEHPDPRSLLTSMTPEGRGFDAVIEAIGLPQTWELAVNLVRRGGRVNWFGGCKSGETVTLDTRRIHYDEISIISPFHHTPDCFQKALAFLGSGKVDPIPLITQTRPMAEFEAALLAMEAGQAIKIALKN